MSVCSFGRVDAALRLCFGGVAPALAMLLLLPAAGGQSPSCAPVPSQQHRGLEPRMTAPFADAEILAALQDGYRLLYVAPAPNALQEAQTVLTNALSASLSKKNRCAQGLAAYALGEIADRTDFAQAETWFERAESAFADVSSALGIARSHLLLAGVHEMQGHEQQSKQEYAEAAAELEAAGDPSDAIGARIGALTITTDYPAQYAALEQQAHAIGPCREADVLRLWGDQSHSDGKFEAAMEHYESAEQLFARCDEDSSSRAALETSMGRLERQQGRPAMALPHYREALTFQRQSGDPSYIPQTYNAMAVAYEAMNDLPRAIALYKRGLAEARRLHSQPFIDFLNANLGATYARSGHPALGIPLLEAATQHLTADYSICYRQGQLSSAYRKAGRLREALEHVNVAIPACERKNIKEGLSSALGDRAETESALGQMEAAWADASRALEIVEDFRAHLVKTDVYKQGYISARETRSAYDLAITILMRRKRYEQAFEVAEQGRARALLDLLASGQTGSPGAESGSVPAGAAAGRIASPEHTGALTAPEMLDEAARLHTTLLAYWLTDSMLFTWVARPGEPVLGVRQTIRPAELKELIESTLLREEKPPGARPMQEPPLLQVVAARRGGAGGGTQDASSLAAWRRLYAILIAPVASALPRDNGALLTIVPSGPLFRVSFAALADPRGRFLVERYRTHTIPMVGLLRYTHQNAANADSLPAHYLFIAAPKRQPAGSDGLPLPALPGTAAEVHAVAALLPAAEVTTLTGDEAVAGSVEREAPQATVLHFATHAMVDSEHPERTFLALDASDGGGRLTLDDIYALHLHARLVVLSACSTGLGKISGDGVAGLSRAFFYAGSASVLATLWDVADQPTAAMLPRFYRALERGETPSEALRSAQLSMLGDLRRGRIRVQTLRGRSALPPSPLYWAAFTLSGEP